MQSGTNKKVYVMMSGGVDSSVASLLLQKEGYDVYGFFMQGWTNPHFECTWKEDRQDAARVAAILNIPFRVLDFSREYHDRVVSYLISEYQKGRTPNPDVMCNTEIKFGVFFDWALANGADYVATGHYVKRREASDGTATLYVAADSAKDQSYFLWGLSEKHIERTLFPIGEYEKSRVRALAEEAGLPTATKKDSQGICFVGEGNMADFLKDYISVTPGPVRTTTGSVVGTHAGQELVTIGQRHGLGVYGGGNTYYAVAKDAKTNTVVVAENSEDPALYKKELSYSGVHWITAQPLPLECKARIRYRAPLASAVVYTDKIIFNEPQRAVAPGQSIVFYDANGQMLGGAVIESAV